MRVFHMGINGLLRTANVMTIVTVWTFHTVLFVRSFVKFALSAVGKGFATNFAIVIVKLNVTRVGSTGLQGVFGKLKDFTTMFTYFRLHGLLEFLMAI